MKTLSASAWKRAVKLAEVAHLAGLEADMPGRDDLLARFALVVDDLRGRQVDDLPPGLFDAPAEIQFLRVHEVPFVEAADLGQDLATHHQRRADDPVHILPRLSWRDS